MNPLLLLALGVGAYALARGTGLLGQGTGLGPGSKIRWPVIIHLAALTPEQHATATAAQMLPIMRRLIGPNVESVMMISGPGRYTHSGVSYFEENGRIEERPTVSMIVNFRQPITRRELRRVLTSNMAPEDRLAT